METKLLAIRSYEPDQASKLCLEIAADVLKAVGKKDYDRYWKIKEIYFGSSSAPQRRALIAPATVIPPGRVKNIASREHSPLEERYPMTIASASKDGVSFSPRLYALHALLKWIGKNVSDWINEKSISPIIHEYSLIFAMPNKT